MPLILVLGIEDVSADRVENTSASGASIVRQSGLSDQSNERTNETRDYVKSIYLLMSVERADRATTAWNPGDSEHSVEQCGTASRQVCEADNREWGRRCSSERGMFQ
jgi:hypothetical protein